MARRGRDGGTNGGWRKPPKGVWIRGWLGGWRQPPRGVRTRGRLAAACSVLLAAGVGVGCADDAPREGREELRIVVVTHGQPADPFWSVVSNGARAAGRDLGVRVEYQAPSAFDMVDMSDLIQGAVASRPSGLVVSIPDPDALEAAIRDAVASGIPTVSINSGGDVFRDFGLLAHVGQTEYEAGRGAGERMAEAGVGSALCVNQEVGNLALDLRCRGFADALEAAGGTVRVLAVELADPEGTRERVAAALRAGDQVDGLLTLATIAAEPALQALDATGRAGGVHFGTFDLSPEVLAAVRDGRMAFAIDQQQYLQGYLPVVFLTQYLETGTMPGGGEVIRTGPGFVLPEDAEAVMDWTRQGVR